MNEGHAEPQLRFLAWRREHALPPGTLCRNCGTALLGPWCHECGQSAHDFHRHASHLIWETFESLFHTDGRLWRTLPRLVLRPASLTRDYLEGKRAPQIPPLRLFLVVLLILFLAGGLQGRGFRTLEATPPPPEARAALQKLDLDVGLPGGWDRRVSDWLRVHIGRAADHPAELVAAMRERGEDFAFLMLPISALILALIFVRHRAFVLFDHLIFSMHSLSFVGLLFSTVILSSLAPGGLGGLLLWAAPAHLFVHMRGVYGTGVMATLVRMAVLFVLSGVAFGLLMAALVLVSLNALQG